MRVLAGTIAVVAVLGAACTAGPPDVAVHNDNGYPDAWVGMVLQVPSDARDQLTMVEGPTGDTDLHPGEGIGLVDASGVVLKDEWGSSGNVQAAGVSPGIWEVIRLIESQDATAGTEVMLLGVVTVDSQSQQSVISVAAALKMEAVGGYHLHQECYLSDSMEFAVALRDASDRVVEAWRVEVVPDRAFAPPGTFHGIDADALDRVVCENAITG